MAGELELAGELGPARAIRLFPRAMPSDSSWLDVAPLCGGSAFTRIFETRGRELFTTLVRARVLRAIGPFTARITELTRQPSGPSVRMWGVLEPDLASDDEGHRGRWQFCECVGSYDMQDHQL